VVLSSGGAFVFVFMTHDRPIFRMVALLAVVLSAGTVRAADAPSREYAVKAAFIYNFAQFTEWPADAFKDDSEPLVIAVIGPNPFGNALDRAVHNKSVGTHPLAVRYYGEAREMGRCHVVYAGTSDPNKIREVIQAAGTSAVLTVGESEQFLTAGGAIRFFMEDGKVRFEVNLDAANQAKLKLSSKLLKLARIFRGAK
jgi:hypothetical protein